MTQNLAKCVFRILNKDNKTAGTGFLVDSTVGVTCAHVIADAVNDPDSGPGCEIEVIFVWHDGQAYHEEKRTALVMKKGWSPVDEEDTAFLRLKSVPTWTEVVHLASAQGRDGHDATCLGYPEPQSGRPERSLDKIAGMLALLYPRLQFQSNVVRRGFSGSPVLDMEDNQVVGMVTWGTDKVHEVVVHAVPADTLKKLWPELVFKERVQVNAKKQAPFMVESPPVNFVPRLEEYEAIIDALLNRSKAASVGITTALRGAGGYGKTTLARAVCYDQRVREAFPDGVLWVTLGENPSEQERVAKVGYMVSRLTGEKEELPDLSMAAARLHEELSERQVLLVVDDVWNGAHLKTFLQGGPRCGCLITTRNEDTLPGGTKKINVDAMQKWEASRVVAAELPEGNEEELQQMAARLGRWPLLLSLANGHLRSLVENGYSLEQALQIANEDYDQQGMQAFNALDREERNQAGDRALAVSVAHLGEDERRRFLELAVFPGDMEIPLAAIKVLWDFTSAGKINEGDVRRLCFRFVQRSLLQKYDPQERKIRLHDVVRKYLVNQWGERITGLHEALLEGYRQRCPGGWSTGPRDGYFISWLVYHLVEAGQKEELETLLVDFQWIDTHLRNGNISELLEDYDYVIHSENEYSERLSLVRNTLRLSAHVLVKDSDQLAGQLIARLLNINDNSIQKLLVQARKYQSLLWLRPVFPCLPPPSSVEIRTIEGNSGSIFAVFVSPDGNHLISADNAIKLWHLNSGEFITFLDNPPKKPFFVDVSPNGRMMVIGYVEGVVDVLDIKSWKQISKWKFKEDARSISCSSITDDGRFLILGYHAGIIQIFDLNKGQEVNRWKGHEPNEYGFGGLHSLIISQDNSNLISAGSDNLIKIWDINNGNLKYTLTGHSSWINALTITPDGVHLISGADEIIEWDLTNGKMNREIGKYPYGVCSLAVSPNGNFLLTGGNDWMIRVWDLYRGREISTIKGHLGEVNSIAITLDGKMAVSGSTDEKIKLWDLKRLEPSVKHDNPGTNIMNCVAMSPDGKFIVTGSIDGNVRIWDTSTGKVSFSCPDGGSVESVAISSDNQFIYSGSELGLKVWDSRNGSLIADLGDDLYRVSNIVADKNHKCIVFEGFNKRIDIWDVNRKQILQTLNGFGEYKLPLAINSDNNLLASKLKDAIVIWDLESGQIIRRFEGHSDIIRSIAFSPDGQNIILDGENNIINVLEIETGKVIRFMKGHSSLVESIVISSDGCFMVSASRDNSIKLWNFKTGTLLAQFWCYASATSCAIAPDGKTIVGTDEGGNVYFLYIEGIDKLST